jgi:hypothetical protein
MKWNKEQNKLSLMATLGVPIPHGLYSKYNLCVLCVHNRHCRGLRDGHRGPHMISITLGLGEGEQDEAIYCPFWESRV